eukprot:8392006-Heterocapsa_arctica.AAC.1
MSPIVEQREVGVLAEELLSRDVAQRGSVALADSSDALQELSHSASVEHERTGPPEAGCPVEVWWPVAVWRTLRGARRWSPRCDACSSARQLSSDFVSPAHGGRRADRVEAV